MELHIITPVSRPQNLTYLWKSIDRELKPIQWRWHVVLDIRRCGPEIAYGAPGMEISECCSEGLVGHCCRNRVINRIADGVIYCLDDDNIIHPGFKAAWHKLEEGFGVIFMCQVRKDGSVYLPASSPDVDTGRVLVKRDILAEHRFKENKVDGDQDMFRPLRDKATIFEEPACYYNYLR